MRVLVTRPVADAREMMARIAALGCRVSAAPLLKIVHEQIPPDAFDGVAGFIATSRNAVAALAASPALQSAISRLIFAVGAATAKRAEQAGFQTVIRGPGTAAELIPIVLAHPASKAGRIVHLAGDHVAIDLAGALANRGVDVEKFIVYRSLAVDAFSAETARDLRAGAFDAVILMSPRTAKIWRALVTAPSRRFDHSAITHVCLSAPVADALRDDGFQPRFEIAAAPTVAGVVSVIERLAPRSAAQ